MGRLASQNRARRQNENPPRLSWAGMGSIRMGGGSSQRRRRAHGRGAEGGCLRPCGDARHGRALPADEGKEWVRPDAKAGAALTRGRPLW